MSDQIPPVAAVIVHEVEDWDKWKAAFDAHASARKEAGVLGHHINRSADNPNLIGVYLPGSDGDKLKALFNSSDLKAKMSDAGVKGPPTISFMTPIAAELDKRDIAGAIIRHNVKDFDVWKKAYDAHRGTRRDKGITGDAVNRSADNPGEVIVYLQADSLDTLESFVGSEDLKNAMQQAGVEGAPDITFWNGGHWGQY